MTRAVIRFLAVATVLASTVPWAPTAAAKIVEPEMSLSNDRPHVRQTFAPFSEANPFSARLYPSYEDCKNPNSPAHEYCHLVVINWQPDEANGHEVFIEVGWEENECCLVVILYDRFGTNRGQGKSDGSNPDGVEGPGEGGLADLEPGTYHLALINDGITSGYWVDARAEFVKITLPEGAQAATPRPRVTPRPRETPRPRPTPVSTVEPDPTPTPEQIAMPGEDGPTSGRDLPVVAAGGQAAPLEQGRSLWATILTILLLAGVAGGGTAFVVMRIRRDIKLGP